MSSAWRDVIYKGNDNYYLEGTSTNAGRPALGAFWDGVYGEVYGTDCADGEHVGAPGGDV